MNLKMLYHKTSVLFDFVKRTFALSCLYLWFYERLPFLFVAMQNLHFVPQTFADNKSSNLSFPNVA